MPVPIVKHILVLLPFAPPEKCSAKAAQFTSFSTSHGILNIFSTISFIFVPV